MIVSHGKLVIVPEQLNEALHALKKMAAHSIKEPGCISYDYYQSLSKPNVMMLFQEWESVDAINAHFQTEHMREFLTVLPNLLEQEVITHRYSIENREVIDALRAEHEGETEIEFELDDKPVTLH